MTSSGAKRMEGHLETPSQGTAEKYPDAMVLMSIFFEAVSSVQVNARTASINNCFLILVIICI